MEILSKDQFGNTIIDSRNGWELNTVDGWYEIGYSDATYTCFDDLESELEIGNYSVANEFAYWLCETYPEKVHSLNYEMLCRGFCVDCNYYLSSEPVDSEFIHSAYATFCQSL